MLVLSNNNKQLYSMLFRKIRAVKHAIIKAVQISSQNSNTPLLPPNQFRNIDGKTNFCISNSHDARCLYNRYAKFYTNRFNRRKYVDGAIYTDLFHDCCDVIDPLPGGII